ncbi:MAG: hypothetical protein R3B81_16080 [bacterium]
MTAGRRIATTAMAVILWLLGACDTAPSRLPDEFLGRWYYSGSSGGLTGSIARESIDAIVIRSDNTMETQDDAGRVEDRVSFTVRRGPTIFSTEDQWILEQDGDQDPPVAVLLSEDRKTLTLSQIAYDGMHRTFSRGR